MKRIFTALIPLLLMACASTPKPTPPTEATTSSPATAKSEPAKSSNLGQTPAINAVPSAEIEAKRLAAELQALQKKSVYFDFDKYAVKPEYQEVVQQQASFIKTHKNDIVTVEGNADERGSAEYNLALGDRRANAVRKNLELLGIPTTQIKTLSLGEEKPRLTCHQEKCWQENRRDDFIHKLNQVP